MFCPNCGVSNVPQANFCVTCGHKLKRDTLRFCPQCGTRNLSDGRFCVECGQGLEIVAQTTPESPAPLTSEPEIKTQQFDQGISAATTPNPIPVIASGRVETEMTDLKQWASKLKYCQPFRAYQQTVLTMVEKKLKAGERQYHLVAPPGAGKTILGLELAKRLGRHTVVLCPNTAIQAQWMDKVGFFLNDQTASWRAADLVGTHEGPLRPITVLTYQALSTANGDDELLMDLARTEWLDRLKAERQMTSEEALDRLRQMEEANPSTYRKELGSRKDAVRKRLLGDPQFDVLRLLHPNAKELIARMAAHEIGTVIVDECHHLTGFWAIIVGQLIQRLSQPAIVGLTATPPMDRNDQELSRYLDVVGEIDFQVPTPAVVKEGNLAPYQDLVYFTHPLPEEMAFIADQHESFQGIVRRLTEQDSAFVDWIDQRVNERLLSSGKQRTWANFVKVSPGLAVASVKLLRTKGRVLEDSVRVTEEMQGPLTITDWAYLLEDYALINLKVSKDAVAQEQYREIGAATRSLGLVLTETGFRQYISAVDRVLSLSRSKIDGLTAILGKEHGNLAEDLRAVVITDFEKTSATALRQIEGVLDAEAGGAVAVMRALTSNPLTDTLDPVLMTGNTVLCDDDLVERFILRAKAWLEKRGVPVELRAEPVEGSGFFEIKGIGPQWNSRLYIMMITALFEEGITKCLIGTRGLLGEGWDSLALNTLIDLTYATTFMTVNQLRGRSLRLDAKRPRKVANNWDVVCLSPEFEKGYADYDRFVRKHQGFHGLCDDGQIESGVGHVHPSLTSLAPETLAEQMAQINEEMLERSAQRDKVYDVWRIGEPYANQEAATAELKVGGAFGQRALQPPGKSHGFLERLQQYFAVGGHRPETQSYVEDIAEATLLALREAGLVSRGIRPDSIRITLRSDGFYRVYLDKALPEDASLFAQSVLQVLVPIENPRYLVPRYELPGSAPADAVGALFGMMRQLVAPSQPKLVMWHAVPDALAASKDKAQIFGNYWNRYVSAGEVLYAKGEQGQEIVARYRRDNPLAVEAHQRMVWR